MVISGSPSGGRTGAWGLAVSWGWSHCTSPKEQTARKRGGRGDCACWLGAFLGWSHCTSTRKHPASMRSKQGTQERSPKKSNIMPARNAREEAPKRVTWEPQRGADGSLGAGCFLGLEPLHQPQGTDSPQAGRAGGLRLLAGGFLGLEPLHQHKKAPSEHAQQARNAREEPQKE